MEGGILIFLCLTMLFGSFIAGMLPLSLNLSEVTKQCQWLSIFGDKFLLVSCICARLKWDI